MVLKSNQITRGCKIEIIFPLYLQISRIFPIEINQNKTNFKIKVLKRFKLKVIKIIQEAKKGYLVIVYSNIKIILFSK